MNFKKKKFDNLTHDELIARQKRQLARLFKRARLLALKNYNKDIKKHSFLNNTTGSYFAIPENTIIAFQTETVAVRIGGTGAGNNGDCKAFIETGVAINEAGTLSIDKSRTNIATAGTTTGWISDITVSGTNLVQTVKGANNRTLMWATTIRMTQIKTGVAL